MSVRLTRGTKEYVDVNVEDTTGVITSLSGSSPTFTVYATDTDGVDTGSPIYNATGAVAVGMMIQCLLDTSAAGPLGAVWAAGLYHLYVSFTESSEVPKLGPFDIYLI